MLSSQGLPSLFVLHVQALIADGCYRQRVIAALADQCTTFDLLLSAPQCHSDGTAQMPAPLSGAGRASQRLLSLKAEFVTYGCCHSKNTIVCLGTSKASKRVRTALASVLVQ